MMQKFRPVFLFIALSALTIIASPTAMARSGPSTLADLAEKLIPTVVNISTTQSVANDDMVFPDMPEIQIPKGSPFEDFFKDFMEKKKNNGGSKAKKRKSTALGSGFIIDASGYIVTNAHVIQDADEITVILHDDTNLTASVVGRDKKTDIALLKVTPQKPLTAISWGDSDKTTRWRLDYGHWQSVWPWRDGDGWHHFCPRAQHKLRSIR